MDLSDRPAAMLTSRQRGVITGEADIGPRGKRSSRARIRARLRAGFADCHLILQNMGVDDIKTALEQREPPTPGSGEEAALENGMASAIGLIHLAGLDRITRPPSKETGTRKPFTDTRFVEARATKGIRLALNRLGMSVETVDVNIDITVGEEFAGLDDLDAAELAEYSESTLLQARQEGAIERGQFMDAMDEKGRVLDSEE